MKYNNNNWYLTQQRLTIEFLGKKFQVKMIRYWMSQPGTTQRNAEAEVCPFISEAVLVT